jgi:hypothetical protein
VIVSASLSSTPGPWCVAAIGQCYHVVTEEVAIRMGATILYGSIPYKSTADRVAERLDRRDRKALHV